MTALFRTRRLAWGLALVLALVGLTFSYVSGSRYVGAVALVEHTQQVEQALEAMLSGLKDEESGQRGFVITGNPAFLEQLEQARSVTDEERRTLERLIRDNPEQSARLRRFEPIMREKRAFIARSVELRKSGSVEEVIELIQSGRGKQLMDTARQLVTEMKAEERRLLAQRSEAAVRTQHETVFAIVICTLMVFGLIGGSAYSMYRDGREVRRTAEELAESEERYRVLVENATELVRLHALDGHAFFVSPSVRNILGYTPQQVIQAAPFSLVHPEDIGLAKYMLARLQSGAVRQASVTYRLRHREGEYRWFEFHFARVDAPGGQARHYQSSGRDITVRRELEHRLAEQAEELRHLSLRDGLTGLYNRRGFLELSQQVVRVAEREQHQLAVVFVDLDGLKAINDGLGHEHGDRAISEAGELLRSTCRATDLVARLGGDEFVVLAGNVDENTMSVLRSRLDRALADRNALPEREYQLAFSLGFALYDPRAPVPIEQLISEADARMYQAKQARRTSLRTPSAASVTAFHPSQSRVG
jgi:diguanylate cyclase (GGDEF)-like protein/PAS domain S-box-containing protein